VGLVDGLPAADAGAVEAQAFLEGVFAQLLGGDGEVLPQAGEVHEAQIDGLDLLLADQGQNLFGGHRGSLPGWTEEWGRAARPAAQDRYAGAAERQGQRSEGAGPIGLIGLIGPIGPIGPVEAPPHGPMAWPPRSPVRMRTQSSSDSTK